MSQSRTESEFISLPCQDAVEYFGENKHFQFGFAELKGMRPTQEDALVWQTLDFSESLLSPIDIAYRLWTTYLILDDALSKTNYAKNQGCTACTTVYDGNGQIIVANLADSVSFIVFYDKQGLPMAAKRLNSVLHKPEDDSERQRIEVLGGFIQDERVAGVLAITRSFGDFSLNFLESSKNQYKMVSAAPKLEIYAIKDIISEMQLESVDTIHIINTCDGFTEPTDSDNASVHEHYLLEQLLKIALHKPPAKVEPLVLAKQLAECAYIDGSEDNISIAVQVLVENQAFVMGLYDGHGGPSVSTYVAKNFLKQLNKQLFKENFFYAKQVFSVYALNEFFNQDNSHIPTVSVVDRMHPLIREQFSQEPLSSQHQAILRLNPVEILSYFRNSDVSEVNERHLFLIHYNHPRLNLRVYDSLFKILGYGMPQLLQFAVMVNRLDIVSQIMSSIPESKFVSKEVLHEFLSQPDADVTNFPINIEILFETSLQYGYVELCEYFLNFLERDVANSLIEQHQQRFAELDIEVKTVNKPK